MMSVTGKIEGVAPADALNCPLIAESPERGGPQRRRHHWVILVTLCGIVAMGAALRLYHIQHESLWWDEALSLTVGGAPLAELPRYFKLNAATPIRTFGWNVESEPIWENHPPLYFAALHTWLGTFGYGPLQARLMSATAGVLALVMLFALGIKVFDGPTGLIATLLLAVSQLGIMYSQEARHYELLLLLYLTTLYLYVVARFNQSAFSWVCCTVSAVLMVGTHYYGAIAVFALAVHIALEWRRMPMPVGWLVGAAAGATAALLPWMMFTLGDQIDAVRGETLYRWSRVRATTVFSVFNKFNNGAVDGIVNTMPRWTFIVGAVLFTAPAVMVAVRWLKVRKVANSSESFGTSLCVAAVLVPIAVVVFGLGSANVKFDIRYVAFCIAPYYLLVAAGLRRLRSIPLKCSIVTVILCYSGYALRSNYFIPYRENFRDAASYVANRSLENDCYAFVPFAAPPLGWMIYMPGPAAATVLTPDSNPSSLTPCQRIWVVTYQRGQDEKPIPSGWQEWLRRLASRTIKVDEQRFFWIRVELYTSAGTQFSQSST